MIYEGKLIAENGAELVFEFEADSNALASAHIAHVSFDPKATEEREIGGGEWNRQPTGLCVKAEFRRHYAEKWIASVRPSSRSPWTKFNIREVW